MAMAIYQEVQIIIDLLKKEGHQKLAEELNDDMLGAATSGELCAACSFGIGEALEAKLSETTRARAMSIKKQLDDALNK